MLIISKNIKTMFIIFIYSPGIYIMIRYCINKTIKYICFNIKRLKVFLEFLIFATSAFNFY